MDAQGLALIGLAGLLAGVATGALTLRRYRRADERDRSAVAQALLDGALALVVVGLILGKLHPLSALGAVTDSPTVSFTPLVFVFSDPALALAQVAVFVPFGVLLALRFPRLGLLRLLLAGAVLAAVIEAAQLLHPMRRTLLDDVITSALGTLLGGAPVVAARRRRTRATV